MNIELYFCNKDHTKAAGLRYNRKTSWYAEIFKRNELENEKNKMVVKIIEKALDWGFDEEIGLFEYSRIMKLMKRAL